MDGALWLRGVIDRTTGVQFRDHLKPGMPIVLSSPGGDTGSAMRISEAVRQSGNPVLVKDRCYSACVLIFAMGRARWMLSGSRIGIHGVGRPDVPVDPERERQIRGYWTMLYLAQIRRGSPALAEAVVQRDMMGSFERMTYLTLTDLDAIDQGWARQAPQDIRLALAGVVHSAAARAPSPAPTAAATRAEPAEQKPPASSAAVIDRLDPASYRGWDALGGGITAAIVGPAIRHLGTKHELDAARLVPCATVLRLCR